jgi:hypothetical protein
MRKIKLTREKELETILTISVFFVVFYFVTRQQHKYLLGLSLAFGIVGMTSKFLTAKIAWVWMKLSEIMGAISSRVILTGVFYLILFPVSLLARVFSKRDSILLKKSSGTTYYKVRNHTYQPADLENTW